MFSDFLVIPNGIVEKLRLSVVGRVFQSGDGSVAYNEICVSGMILGDVRVVSIFGYEGSQDVIVSGVIKITDINDEIFEKDCLFVGFETLIILGGEEWNVFIGWQQITFRVHDDVKLVYNICKSDICLQSMGCIDILI